MGVKGLQTYIEKSCPEACCEVNLRQLTDTYRRSHPGVEPVIVVDGLGCLGFLNEKVEWLYGGQFLQIKARVEKFVKNFRQLGITLVFFFDGLMASSKTEEWIARRLKTLKNAAGVFASVRAQIPLAADVEPIYPGGVSQALERAIKDACDSAVFINMVGECDTTIVSYAVAHQCMGILGQDTDFLIYDVGASNIPYLLLSNLKFDSMTTVSYSQEKFCQKTGVPSWLLPLFACLVGNDSVTREQLVDFHHELNMRYANYRSPYPVGTQKAIQFVIKYLNANKIGKSEQLAGLVSQLCLSMPLHQVPRNKFMEAMAVYRLDSAMVKYYPSPKDVKNQVLSCSDDDYLTVVYNKTAIYDLVPIVYQVLTFGKVERLPSLEDESDRSFASIVVIYRDLRCRMYSVIFKFRDLRLRNKQPIYWGETVEEFCLMTSKKSVQPDVVKPLPIQSAPFDVMKFWLDTGNLLMTDKIAALISVIGSTMSPQRLNTVPDQFKSLCLLLNYLIQHSGVPLTIPDVDAFIVQAVIPNSDNILWIGQQQVKPQTRAMHLATIFSRGVPHMMDVVSLCGNPYPIASTSHWNYFDGKRFHYCWSALKSGKNVEQLCQNNATSLENFRKFKDATFEGINVKKFFHS